MLIKINKDRTINNSNLKAGWIEENLAKTLEFEFPENLKEYNKIIEFEFNGEKAFDVITNDSYELKNNITKYPLVLCQIVFTKAIENEEIRVCKTDTFMLNFSNSINANKEINPEDENINILNTLLTETNIALNEVKGTQEELEKIVQDLKDNVESGYFNGEDGATFTPSITEDGELSWTNDKNLPNPKTINIKGKDGKDFSIYKTYSSIEDMNNDKANVEEGSFVLIANSVEIEDNAKLYVKSKNDFVYLTDLSGATGIKGEPGEKGEKGDKGEPGEVTLEQLNETISENNLSEREISDNKYARALKKEVSETDFTQVFAENEKIEGLQIYGEELTQEVREGYNELDINSLSTLTKNGVTWTINGDGSISVSGTCVNYESNVTLKAGKLDVGEYTYKCFGLPSTCKTNIWSVGDVTGEGIRRFTAKEGVDHNVVVVVPIGETVNFTIKPMLVKGSYTNETLPPYEQYGAMPSLDFPSEVHTMNDRVNLFDINSITDKTQLIGRINDNYGATTSSQVTFVTDFIKVNANDDITLSFTYDSLLNTAYRGYCFYDTEKQAIMSDVDTVYLPSTKKLTIKAKKNGFVRFGIDKNCYDVKIAKGTQTSPYSPHGQGSLKVYDGNKNFLPNTAKTQTINGVTLTVNEDGSVLANGTATAQTDLYLVGNATEYISLGTKQGNYILSGCPSNGSSSTYMLLLVPKGKSGMVNSKTPTQITIENGDTFRALIRIMSGVTVSNLLFKPMIRLATDEDDTYVPHQSQATLIPFPQDTFAGAIGSYKDTIKEVDGRWKVEKKLEEYAMTGTENLVIDGTYNGITQFRFTPKVLPLNGLDKISTIMSNYFKGTFYSNSWVRDNTVTVKLSSSFVRFMTSKYSTVEEFKAKLTELYNAGTPVKIYYVINKEYVDLSDETQEILNGIKLRLGLNNFSIDVGTFSMIYNKSLAKELEEKDALIEELASRILALENATLNLAEGE